MTARKMMTAGTAVVILLSLLTGSVNAVGLMAAGNPVARFPWTARDIFVGNEGVDRSLTVRLGGNELHPLVSYENRIDDYTSRLMLMRPSVFDPPSGCAFHPSNWICEIPRGDIYPSSLSSMETYNFIDTFKVSWAYHMVNTDLIVLYTQEFMHSLERVSDPYNDPVTVVDLNYFPENNPASTWKMLGAPALQFDEFGNPHFAFVIFRGNQRALVYAHRASGPATTPCNSTPNTRYQCEIIFQTDIQGEGVSEAWLALNSNNHPRITYLFFAGTDFYLRYAYPASALLHPNCGPGNNTWRCITIEQSTPANLIFEPDKKNLFEIAAGPTGSHAQLAYRSVVGNTTRIRYAHYVGTGGNCGYDYALLSGEELRWQCESIPWIGTSDPAYHNFSLEVDSMGYPVIAANRLEGTAFHAELLYPPERVGMNSIWVWQDIDGRETNSGRMAFLDLAANDSGALVFIEDREYEPTIRLAQLNVSKIFLPQLKR